MKKEDVIRRFEAVLNNGETLIGMGAGMGLSAKVGNAAGVDFITTDANDYFVAQGRGEGLAVLPICDTNALLQSLAPEIVSMSKNTPAFAGIYGNDTFRDMCSFLQWIKAAGFSGVFNAPSMNEFDGYAKTVHDSVKINYDKELEMLKIALSLGLYTIGVAFSGDDATACAKAGLDMVIAKAPAYAQYTAISDRTERLGAICETLQQIVDGAHAACGDMLVVAHSKMIEEPEDFAFILEHTKGLSGYHGTVTIEGYPVRAAIQAQIAAFKAASY